jgi:hypothetical protein
MAALREWLAILTAATDHAEVLLAAGHGLGLRPPTGEPDGEANPARAGEYTRFIAATFILVPIRTNRRRSGARPRFESLPSFRSSSRRVTLRRGLRRPCGRVAGRAGWPGLSDH